MKKQNFRLNFLEIFLIFVLILYTIKLVFFPLTVQTGGSEMYYWAYFQDYLNFFKNFDYQYMQNYRWFPQEWRWGFYIIPILFNFIFENINLIYITSVFNIFVAFIIYIIILKKYYSFFPLLFFIVTWILHPDIEKYSYSFSTNSLSILVIALISYYLTKFKIDNINLKEFIILILLFFWLYGIKEANLMFVTFIPIIVLINKNLKLFYTVCFLGLSLYLIESIFVYFITSGEIVYGRFLYHFLSTDTYAWVNHVTSEELRWGSPQYSVKNFSREFLDGGIFSRWFFTGLTFIFFYVFAFLRAFSNIKNKSNHFIYNISILYLCYFFTISFALVSLFPPKPLIHFNLGIQVIGFPLALIIFVDFLESFRKDFKNKYIFFFIFGFMTVLLNLKSLNHINKVSIKSILSNNYNLFTFEKNIIKVSKNINQSDCVYIKGMGNHLIYVLGEKYLNKNF